MTPLAASGHLAVLPIVLPLLMGSVLVVVARRAPRLATALGFVSLLGVIAGTASPAFAQQAPADTEGAVLESIVVTGSRIRRSAPRSRSCSSRSRCWDRRRRLPIPVGNPFAGP